MLVTAAALAAAVPATAAAPRHDPCRVGTADVRVVFNNLVEALNNHQRWANRITNDPTIDTSQVGDYAWQMKWVRRYQDALEVVWAFAQSRGCKID